jgi:chromosome segregation ATPase
MHRFLTVLAFAAALAVSGVPARSQDQPTGDPVADAARKAREQQKTAQKPKKVFTDDDVSAAKPTAAVPSSASTDSKSGEATATKGAGSNPTKGSDANSESAWRKRFAEQRKKIADAELELDVLQREAQKLDLQYYSDPQKAMQQQYSRQEINDKNAKIEEKKKQIADLKQQLSDLEDELRKSGGEPGWARQ